MGDYAIQDPTDYLAAERTFLAWTRTALAVMVIGFGAAHLATNELGSWVSAFIALLTALMLTVAGTVRYYQVIGDLESDSYESNDWGPMGVSCGVALLAVGYSCFLGYEKMQVMCPQLAALMGRHRQPRRAPTRDQIETAVIVAAGIGMASA
eukprot:TRINITY_DN32952_c0_g1_i1.p1 TRINITY_DN32952_c0_g1~~TRINITY_DN32952_c0_g1_i1.p1  ORF type:complete len:152 (-),score=23.02 TRINITY_DN32952_c0_g1_i1:88-543(-)